MLKVMKWEFLKRFYDLRYFFILLMGIVIINLLLPVEFKDNYHVLALFSSLYGGMFFALTCIYTIIASAKDLRSPNIYLEKTVVKKSWEVLGSKLVINFLWLNILYIFVSLLARVLKRFSTLSSSYLEVRMPYYTILVIGVFLPLAVLFCYLSAKSISFTKRIPVFTTAVMMTIVSVILSRVFAAPPVKEIISGSLFIPVILLTAVSAGLFFGSCRLYEKYYEV